MSINMDQIVKIFMDMRPDVTYFFDKSNNKIISFPINVSATELEKMKKLILSKKDALIKLPRYPSAMNYQDMEEFIPTLNNIQLQKRLKDALNSGGNASKFFRDALMSHSREKEKWDIFKKDRVKKFVADLFKGHGVK